MVQNVIALVALRGHEGFKRYGGKHILLKQVESYRESTLFLGYFPMYPIITHLKNNEFAKYYNFCIAGHWISYDSRILNKFDSI